MESAILYFSGTGNTEQVAIEIQKGMEKKGVSTDLIDITSFNTRQKKFDFNKYDLLIFGFPVYGSLIPIPCIYWFSDVQGDNKPAAMFFTYGGPTMGIAHYHTKHILAKQNFKVIASAEFPCKHSYNLTEGFQFLEDRPNADDFQIAQEFGLQLITKLSQDDLVELDVQKPDTAEKVLENLEKRRHRITQITPTRDGKDCSMCRTCETSCPTAAFNADTGEANGEKCIACMRCVTFCPDGVIEYKRDMSGIFQRLTDHYKLSETHLKNLKSKLFL
jgi:flavodoxin/Pyruvate/2-oxoacid:ferredoxin oxidoreductase delta subunit